MHSMLHRRIRTLLLIGTAVTALIGFAAPPAAAASWSDYSVPATHCNFYLENHCDCSSKCQKVGHSKCQEVVTISSSGESERQNDHPEKSKSEIAISG